MEKDNDVFFDKIKRSKNYKNVCDETIHRLIHEESSKYKSEKDLIKSIKTKLHQITGAFISEGLLTQARNEDNPKNILGFHVSTKERLPFYNEMITDIFNATETKSILDIACGLNPFFMPYMGISELEYHACDINTGCIELINEKLGINGFSGDILYRIPDICVDNVFLFKILPLLEQQKKNYSLLLLSRLKSKYYTISFPTRSLSGKNNGMYNSYSRFMEESFSTAYEFIFIKEYMNELVYIIRKR